jgi:N-glycosidase YbiA
MTAIISSFNEERFFLSNFFSCKIIFDGETYPTVEHAFQAAKTLDKEQRRNIQQTDSPRQAKRLGREVTLRQDWEQIKFEIMLGFLKQKFSQPDLRQQLLETGDAELIEGNTWGDKVWGAVQVNGQWVGENRLGELLMQVRAEIASGERASPAQPRPKRGNDGII